MLDAIGREQAGFDDFRRNGLLLPAVDEAAVRLGLPLHRGPHRRYNEVVFARVGQIEAGWAALAVSNPATAQIEARVRLFYLQRALRRRLFDPRGRRFRLSRHDPTGKVHNFTELDAMAELLWPETEG